MTIGALEASRKVVAKLKAAGINLLALDFDMTVLDIHTGKCSLLSNYYFFIFMFFIILFIYLII